MNRHCPECGKLIRKNHATVQIWTENFEMFSVHMPCYRIISARKAHQEIDRVAAWRKQQEEMR